MRDIEPELLERIQAGATFLTELFEATPRYGEIVRFTRHYAPIILDGNLYWSRPGVDLRRAAISFDLSVDNSELIGGFLEGVVSEGDMFSRRFDGARFKRSLCDYMRLDLAPYVFQTGFLGNVIVVDGVFKAEMRSLSQRLQQNVGPLISPTCRAKRVGDGECRFDLETTQAGTGIPFRLRNKAIENVGGLLSFTVSGMSIYPEDWFSDGILTFETGSNAGFSVDVLRYSLDGDVGSFVLQEPPGLPLYVGDTFTVDAGCNRATTVAPDDPLWHCKNKFKNASNPNGNMLNFQGEPYVIGPNEQYRYAGNP